MGARRSKPAEGQPSEPPSALEVAVHYLGTRPRTRWEISQRLRRAKVPDGEIEAALERLAQLGYVDDAAFARWWGEQRDRHNPRGRRMIESELRQRGVSRDIIEAYRLEHAAPERSPEDEGLPGDELARARNALAKHLRGRPMPADRAARQRVGMYLVRRGFDPDTVRAALVEAGTASDDVPEAGEE